MDGMRPSDSDLYCLKYPRIEILSQSAEALLIMVITRKQSLYGDKSTPNLMFKIA